jgi:hypothetical protein
MGSKPVIEVLSRLVSALGALLLLRSDNAPGFVSHAILEGSPRAASPRR